MQRTQHVLHNLPVEHSELYKHIAYHEAGHVAAIYFRNRQQELPPVYFQITIQHSQNQSSPGFAKVEGGRLIENLPIASIESRNFDSELEQWKLREAYEADVVNLLVGPLAEAKYVALRDDEIFNSYLVDFVALKNYGGYADIEQANHYLAYFIENTAERELTIQSLFKQAFQFIDDSKNWKCIEYFASYLLEKGQGSISCEEASSVLERFQAKEQLARSI